MKTSQLVFLVPPRIGHLTPVVEFSNRLLHHHNSLTSTTHLSITILMMKHPPRYVPNPSTLPHFPNINYHVLPEITPPSTELYNECAENHLSIFAQLHKPHVKTALKEIMSSGTQIAGLFLDMFCTSIIDIANELEIPSYIFYTSGAGFLGLVLHLNEHHQQYGVEKFELSDPEVHVPSYSTPVSPAVMPGAMLTKPGYLAFMEHGKRYREVKGIVVNTVKELESYAVRSLRNDERLPCVYTVGPVIDPTGNFRAHGQTDIEAKDEGMILEWLDSQPDSSVIYLCFGGAGAFDATQVKEIAKGLYNSGVRFIWALRKPRPKDKVAGPSDYTKEELDNLLPEELKRVVAEERRGLICGWVPQAKILNHKAVSVFVSHCGWNSALEAVWFGKVMVVWPMYAEQQINAFQIVKELGLGVELRLDYRKGTGGGGNEVVVKAEELEKVIGFAMEDGNLARKKMEEMKVVVREAVRDGGSSFECIASLIYDLLGNIFREDYCVKLRQAIKS